MPSGVGVELVTFWRRQIVGCFQQPGSKSHGLRLRHGRVVDVEIEMHLLGRTVRPIGRDVIVGELHADHPLIVRIEHAVELVIAEHPASDHPRPEVALGGQIGCIEHDDLPHDLHGEIFADSDGAADWPPGRPHTKSRDWETSPMAKGASMKWTTVTLDCSDAEALAVFYSDLFGWTITARDGAGWLQVRDPDGGIGLNFQAEDAYRPPTWPEQPGHQAKMMHFEILVDDLEGAVERVLRCGGTEAPHQPGDRDQARIRVMLDPAGHPFCLFTPGE